MLQYREVKPRTPIDDRGHAVEDECGTGSYDVLQASELFRYRFVPSLLGTTDLYFCLKKPIYKLRRTQKELDGHRGVCSCETLSITTVVESEAGIPQATRCFAAHSLDLDVHQRGRAFEGFDDPCG